MLHGSVIKMHMLAAARSARHSPYCSCMRFDLLLSLLSSWD